MPFSTANANDVCAYAKQVIEIEAQTLHRLGDAITPSFYEAFQLIFSCKGMVFIAGVGKAGIVGQKISATLASIGVPSVYIHPTDALHGDLGRIRPNDLLIVLSNSGETEEVKSLLLCVKRFEINIIAITGGADSAIAQLSDVVVDIGNIEEACPLGLAPTASTIAMMAIGDALAMSLVQYRRFNKDDFAIFHPRGNIGFKLLKVKEVMRKGEKLPLVKPNDSTQAVITIMTTTPGRPGAAIVVDEKQHLLGIFTDGNLRRLLQSGDTTFLTDPINDHMHVNPKVIMELQSVEEAMAILKQFTIDQVPVINDKNEVVGLLDIQDLI